MLFFFCRAMDFFQCCHGSQKSPFASLLANQLVASESELARDHAGQSEFFVPISRFQTYYLPLQYCYRQLTVSIVSIELVSAIYPFSDWLTILCLAVIRLFTDLITNSNHLQITTVTPVCTLQMIMHWCCHEHFLEIDR